MKRLIATALTCVLLLGIALPAFAADDQKYEFATYFVIYAVKGPNWKPQTDQESMEMRQTVVDNLGKMVKSGEIIIAGLVNDGSDAEFIMIIQTEDEPGLRSRLENAKSVKSGLYAVRMHSWFAPKGLKLDPVPRSN